MDVIIAPAIEAVPLIKRKLAELDDSPSDSVASGRRAAFWLRSR